MAPNSGVHRRIGPGRDTKWLLVLVRRLVRPPREDGLSAPLDRAASLLRVHWKPRGRVRPRRKLKANSVADEAQTFFLKFAAQIRCRLCKDSALVCAHTRWGGGRRGHRAAEPGPRQSGREGASPSLLLANSSAPSVKIVSKVLRTPRMCLWGLHQGGGSFVKAEESYVQKHPPNGAQESLGAESLSEGRMARKSPGEPPAQSSPLTSIPRVNNHPRPALQTSPRRGARRSADEAQTQSRHSRPLLRPLSLSPKTGLRGGEKTSVVSAPTGCPDHHRLPPNSSDRALPLGSGSPGGLARAQSARAGWRGGGCGRSLRRACRPAGRGG